ncbi:hypothetical protein TWF718_000406 [Orbilia javanica]|uniref:DUF7136 domain-containing protein n=1 Tax=Orbilia javanica TaxID=47235 RepID=A0AAN8MTV0_9PEZI
MRPVSHALWSFASSLTFLGAVVNAAAGVLEVGIVFPRVNGTYAPTDKFPIVFALQNAEAAKHLSIDLYSFVRKGPQLRSTFGDAVHDLSSVNFTSEPYFVYHFLNIETEGAYELFSTTTWASCGERPGDRYDELTDKRINEVAYLANSTNMAVPFTIKKDGQNVDLVAATADEDKTCFAPGFAINVTDQTREVNNIFGRWIGTCAVVGSASPTPTANACKVRIDSAAAASMSAVVHAAWCRGFNPPADCPKESTAAQQLAVAGITSFAAVFGAVAFLLA